MPHLPYASFEMHFYEYEELRYSDSIRILILHPSSDGSDPIMCTMQYTRLSDVSLNYEALSYTWGDMDHRQAIYFCGGSKTLLVGQTCLDALRHLRQKSTYRLLWIDAICINQEDLLERGSQVRIMDDIYSHAYGVVVFLGGHTAGSPVLFEELAAAERLLELGDEIDPPSPSSTVVKELENLYTRPWFRRVWVLQEVCGRDFVVFMCGSDSVSFGALASLHFDYSRATKLTKMVWPIALEWIHRPPEELSTPQFNLWHRLNKTRDYLATDPRDRIFALKSLSGPQHSELDFLIDYTQSLEDGCIKTAKFLLPVLGLRMLTAVRHPHQKGMPSWIPDWSEHLPLHPFHSYQGPSGHPAAKEHEMGCKTVNDDFYEIREISGEGEKYHLELLTTGYRHSRIVDMSQQFVFNSMDEAESTMRRLYCSFENLKNIFVVDEKHADCTVIKQLGKLIAETMSLMNGSELHSDLTRRIDGFYAEPHEPLRGEQIRNFFRSLQHCRISMLSTGELAIAPGAIQLDDVVCVLANTNSACALRPDGKGKWTLVSGEIYIFANISRLAMFHGSLVLDEYVTGNKATVEQFVIR
ncbi:hypothetical protein HBI47_142690 [Parastagonospora nodorum]|nr:hypothetical protein HBI47_142690 [Parastagonospora nodorum]